MSLLIPDYFWGIATVWQEARGEIFQGKVAVAEILLKRTKKKFMSDGTIAGTCLWPYQFSGWNTKDPNRLKAAKLDDLDPLVQECKWAWHEAEEGIKFTGEALHYFNPKVVIPDWSLKATVVAEIGNHRFVVF